MRYNINIALKHAKFLSREGKAVELRYEKGLFHFLFLGISQGFADCQASI
jgi:hypothetical protein